MEYWLIIKEKVALWYGRAAEVFLGLNVLLYIACCVVAGGPVGPVVYIGWLNHCCQWKVG